jgi:KDO2-lipid IV(A) lauroyltransferase
MVGKYLGTLIFYLVPKYRKRTLSNLSLASALCLNEKELKNLAKASLGNLLITCLEYGKLYKEKEIHSLVTCENPYEAKKIIDQGKGVIFLCGHQANWELFFLEGTSRMPGVAIGQPIKNTLLYRWVLSIRQKFGGKIVLPKEAVKEGLRALKQGKFLGIVGDQGMPESGFCSPFLGRNAWTSPLPALLSYRSGAPLITATMTRSHGKYKIQYSNPLFPNLNEQSDNEVPRFIREALSFLEKSILAHPCDWLWQHNRWKQQILGKVKKAYRQDAIALFLPKDPILWKELSSALTVFREIYPTELLSVFTPFPLNSSLEIEEHLYVDPKDLFVKDYRYKLIFNFTSDRSLYNHFKKQSMLTYADRETLAKHSHLSIDTPITELIKGAVLNAG